MIQHIYTLEDLQKGVPIPCEYKLGLPVQVKANGAIGYLYAYDKRASTYCVKSPEHIFWCKKDGFIAL